MSRTRMLGNGVVATLTAVAGLAAMAVSAPVASAAATCGNSSWDFDGDAMPDVAVGALYGGRDQSGTVQVRLSNHGRLRVVEIANPEPDEADLFGAALAEVPSYVDEGRPTRCTQLAVGAPGEDAGGSDRGAVYVFAYDQVTRSFSRHVELRPGLNGLPGRGQDGARFGAALAAPPHLEDTEPLLSTLYVGAPGTNRAGAMGAGAVTGMEIDPATARAVNPRTFSWGDGTRAGSDPSVAAEFGATLAVSRQGILFVGAPQQRTGGRVGGAVQWVREATEEVGARSGWLSQATTGVPGTTEDGDYFGQSLAVDDAGRDGPRLLVGIPGEDTGRVRNAGAVAVVPFDANGLHPASRSRVLDQGVPGVAGTPEAGDEFGSAVSVVPDPEASRTLRSYLVGVPGESIGSARRTGLVQTLSGNLAWHQDSPGVPGRAESDDQMGATLSGINVGVPGENDDAGAVISGLPIDGLGGYTWTADQPRSGAAYGCAIGSDAP